MGTPYYMAPEQAEDSRAADVRSDIYSYGATFYHAATGRPPFGGETAFSILFRHKTEPLTSPRSLNPELSTRVSDVLERCLAKSPLDRFQSFAAVLGHLWPAADVRSPWDDAGDDIAVELDRYRSRRAVYLKDPRSLGEPDVYQFPQGNALTIGPGDIVEQEVDAIISSDTSSLHMEYGCSLAILEAAGEEVYRQAKLFAPILPGRAIVTGAGTLKARFVMHGATIGARPLRELSGLSSSRDVLTEIMASCCYHAETLQVRSIAFPLLGTGGAGFPRDVCLDTMFAFLARTLRRGVTTLREARIVLFC